jgi:hypothetical protein
MSAGGGAQAPIKILGYKTTRGDNPTGNSRPTIACGANIFTVFDNVDIHNLIFTGTANPLFELDTNCKIINSNFINSSTTASRTAINAGSNSDSDTFIFNTEAICYRGTAIGLNTESTIIGCYIHDSVYGFSTGFISNKGFIFNNLFESNVTTAINLDGAIINQLIIANNTIYGSENTTGTGIAIATGATDIRILNNIIYGFVTGVSHADTQTVVFLDYNDYFNNDTPRTNVATGSNDQALDPTFTSVAQVTGTTATYAGSTLTDAAASFANVVDNQDFVLIVSGTGLTTANVQYLITSHTATTITTSQDAGESSASDWVYQVTTGRNFAIGTNLKALGFPGAFQAGLTTGYMDIGAVQRQEPAAGGGGGRGARFINN